MIKRESNQIQQTRSLASRSKSVHCDVATIHLCNTVLPKNTIKVLSLLYFAAIRFNPEIAVEIQSSIRLTCSLQKHHCRKTESRGTYLVTEDVPNFYEPRYPH